MIKPLSTLRPFLATLILALPASTALAAPPVDDAGAARLKTMLERLLIQPETIPDEGIQIKTDGPVTVEKADGYYKASLPAYTLSLAKSGASLAFGRVAINATATDAPGQWNMAIALPTPIRMRTPDQSDIVLSIGAQNTRGVWHEALRNFVKLDSRIEAVQVVDSAKRFTLSIPAIVSLYDLNEKAPDRWSGPADILLKGLALNIPLEQNGGPFSLSIDQTGIKSTVNGASIKSASQYREQFEILQSNLQPDQPASPAHTEAVIKLLTKMIGDSFDGFSTTFFAQGVRVQTPAQGGEPARSARLAEAHTSMDMDGFRTGKLGFGLRMGHRGLEITPEPEEAFAPLIPTSTAVDMRIENLPFKDLADLALSSVKMVEETPGMEQMIGFHILASLPGLMSKAGTKLTLRENRAAGKLYDITLNGQAVADSAAAHGVTAKGRMEIAGLDSILTHLNARMEKSPGPERDLLAGQIGSLTVLQALGQQAKNSAGQDVRAYDFIMDPKGKMLLNGADFNSIMASRNAAGAGQPHSVPPSGGTPSPGSAP